MTISTSINNIKVIGNVIDIGRSSTGSAPISYAYDNTSLITPDSTIIGNTFSGCIGNANSNSVLLTLGSSSIVKDNTFVRGAGSPILYYIENTGNNNSIITNNIFDQSTVDGSSSVLINTSVATNIYEKNINQTTNVFTQPLLISGGNWTTGTGATFVTTATLNGQSSIPFLLPQGCTIVNMTMLYQINGTARAPATNRLSWRVLAIEQPTGSTILDLLPGGFFVQVPAYTTFNSQLADSEVISTNNIVDNSNFYYHILLNEEDGAGAVAGNIVFGFIISYVF